MVSERTLELDIIKPIVLSGAYNSILEIGNVTHNWFNHEHDVVDLYEKFGNIINEDIRYYRPNKIYNLIFSISSFEHILDDNFKYPVIDALINTISLLSINGLFVMTILVNYNKDMDLILDNITIFRQDYYKRITDEDWEMCDRKRLDGGVYCVPFHGANELRVCYYIMR